MSSYQFVDIKSYTPLPSDKYLFDANIWLLLLQPPSALTPLQAEYSKFIDRITTLLDIQKKKNQVQIPSIVLTSLVLSEVFNAYMRNSFDLWKIDKIQKAKITGDQKKIDDANNLVLKKDYRETTEYSDTLKIFQSDFLSFKDLIIVLDDAANKIDILDVIEHLPANTDFNDYYYYLFSHEHKLSIVTNDKDYIYTNVPIITNNQALLKLLK